MMRTLPLLVLLPALCAPAGGAGADTPAAPVVIHDSGQTVPLTAYLAKRAPRAPAGTATPPAPTSALRRLPAPSARLSPGPVGEPSAQAREHLRRLRQPLFLVGVDEASRRWLAGNRANLAALKAVGLLVNAGSEEEVRAMQALAPELVIVPASADELAGRLGLTRYPVLLHRGGMDQ